MNLVLTVSFFKEFSHLGTKLYWDLIAEIIYVQYVFYVYIYIREKLAEKNLKLKSRFNKLSEGTYGPLSNYKVFLQYN